MVRAEQTAAARRASWQAPLRFAKIGLLAVGGSVLVAFGWQLLAPQPCGVVARCAEHDRSAPRHYHGLMVCGLLVLLLREASVLVASFVQARGSEAAVWSVADQCLPGMLLCALLAVLASTMTVFAVSENPWAHASAADLDGRPVYTLRYAEWFMTVPMLLTLAGRCALRRPAAEVLRPITVTQVYMAMAWAANVMESLPPRWALVAGTFAGYGWASRDMLRWVTDFLEAEPVGVTCRRLRAASSAMLVALFAVYGVIYLLSYGGVIGTHAEQIAYTTFGFGSKVVMSTLFTAIRAMEHQEALGEAISRISGVSSAFMSLLRGSFDFVVPCMGDTAGECHILAEHAGDSEELERSLGMQLRGTSLNQHLADDSERERFANYVCNVVRHAGRARPKAGASWPGEVGGMGEVLLPPVAQVLHVRLRSADQEGAALKGGMQAVVHLSAVPRRLCAAGPVQLVAGLCLAAAPEPPTPGPGLDAEVVAMPSAPGSACAGLEEASGASATQRPTPSTSAVSASASRGTSSPPTSGLSSGGGSNASDLGLEGYDSKTAAAQKSARLTKLKVRLLDRKLNKGTGRRKARGRSSRGGSELGGTFASNTSETGQSALGGTDVRSQSSKLSGAGSVTMACRQLLGPLHDRLPPAQFVSRRIEDHVQCAAEMVRLRAPAKVAKFRREQELGEWNSRAHGHALHSMLSRGRAPEGAISEEIWHTCLLPHLQEPAPGQRPSLPEPPADDELWLEAWRRTYEDGDEDSEEEDEEGEEGEESSEDEEDSEATI